MLVGCRQINDPRREWLIGSPRTLVGCAGLVSLAAAVGSLSPRRTDLFVAARGCMRSGKSVFGFVFIVFVASIGFVVVVKDFNDAGFSRSLDGPLDLQQLSLPQLGGPRRQLPDAGARFRRATEPNSTSGGSPRPFPDQPARSKGASAQLVTGVRKKLSLCLCRRWERCFVGLCHSGRSFKPRKRREPLGLEHRVFLENGFHELEKGPTVVLMDAVAELVGHRSGNFLPVKDAAVVPGIAEPQMNRVGFEAFPPRKGRLVVPQDVVSHLAGFSVVSTRRAQGAA